MVGLLTECRPVVVHVLDTNLQRDVRPERALVRDADVQEVLERRAELPKEDNVAAAGLDLR